MNWSDCSGPRRFAAGLSRRARAVLLMAAGAVRAWRSPRRTGYTVVQVSRLRRRFAEGGVAGLHERPRSGRPPTLTARQRAQVVALTLRPPAAGHDPLDDPGAGSPDGGVPHARCIGSGKPMPCSRTG